jgi:methyltransferase (TIGR00027 family)
MGRALAHIALRNFEDPTAIALLPESARARVEAVQRATPPKDLREKMQRLQLQQLALLMAARTMEIDAAVSAVQHSQLVILGAGLDGRAWRMPELKDSTVFEVDHPASQRDKRFRVPELTQHAREVRFVPVDFERDDLNASLDAAGHDITRPTTWIWEGVVMYLDLPAIEASLSIIAGRSAPGSRLIVFYHRPAWYLHLIGLGLRRLGEPLRSAFTPEQMRALLNRHGFSVVRDEDLPTIGARLGPEIQHGMHSMRHCRIVTADR